MSYEDLGFQSFCKPREAVGAISAKGESWAAIALTTAVVGLGMAYSRAMERRHEQRLQSEFEADEREIANVDRRHAFEALERQWSRATKEPFPYTMRPDGGIALSYGGKVDDDRPYYGQLTWGGHELVELAKKAHGPVSLRLLDGMSKLESPIGGGAKLWQLAAFYDVKGFVGALPIDVPKFVFKDEALFKKLLKSMDDDKAWGLVRLARDRRQAHRLLDRLASGELKVVDEDLLGRAIDAPEVLELSPDVLRVLQKVGLRGGDLAALGMKIEKAISKIKSPSDRLRVARAVAIAHPEVGREYGSVIYHMQGAMDGGSWNVTPLAPQYANADYVDQARIAAGEDPRKIYDPIPLKDVEKLLKLNPGAEAGQLRALILVRKARETLGDDQLAKIAQLKGNLAAFAESDVKDERESRERLGWKGPLRSEHVYERQLPEDIMRLERVHALRQKLYQYAGGGKGLGPKKTAWLSSILSDDKRLESLLEPKEVAGPNGQRMNVVPLESLDRIEEDDIPTPKAGVWNVIENAGRRVVKERLRKLVEEGGNKVFPKPDWWPAKADAPSATLIRTVGALRKEGDDMAHCAAGHAERVLQGQEHVAKLVGEGVRTTIAFNPDTTIYQHYGAKNRPINEAEAAEEARLLEAIHNTRQTLQNIRASSMSDTEKEEAIRELRAKGITGGVIAPWSKNEEPYDAHVRAPRPYDAHVYAREEEMVRAQIAEHRRAKLEGLKRALLDPFDVGLFPKTPGLQAAVDAANAIDKLEPGDPRRVELEDQLLDYGERDRVAVRREIEAQNNRREFVEAEIDDLEDQINELDKAEAGADLADRPRIRIERENLLDELERVRRRLR